MMTTEEYSPKNKSNKVTRQQEIRKEEIKRKRLTKQQERMEREPSIRLGKIAKKLTARSAKILDIENGEEESTIASPIIGVKQLRLKLARPKRKLGHRGRPEEPIFIEDEHELVFTSEEIAWQTATLEQDDSIM